MTILITADLHLNDLARDGYRHAFVATHLPALLKAHKVDLLLILGDFCDEKDRHGAWLVNAMVSHLKAITYICPIICLKGNHDYIVANNPFFAFLGEIPDVTWIDSPVQGYKVSPKLPGSLFLPHSPNPEREWKGISFKGFEYIFAHQTFAGAAVGPRKLEGVDPNIFPEDAMVISGDIHQPQEFDRVVYVGSPFTVDFGDAFKPRVLLIDGDRLKSLPSPGPQKRLIELESIQDLDEPRMLNKGDILKVRVNLSAAEHAKWPEIKEAVLKWGEDYGFVIHLVTPKVSIGGSLQNRRKAPAQSDEQLLKAYANSRAIGEETLKAGMDLMREA